MDDYVSVDDDGKFSVGWNAIQITVSACEVTFAH